MPDYGGLIEAICTRCESAGIEFSLKKREGIDRPYLALQLPAGRRTRPIAIGTAERAEMLLASDFESWTFLGDYEAIASYQDGVIKAHVRTQRPGDLRRLARAATSDDTSNHWDAVRFSVARADGVTCRLAKAAPDDPLRVLALRPWVRRTLAIELSGLSISRHESALTALEHIASSFLFDLDMQTDASVVLERHRPYARGPRRPAVKRPTALAFPKHEYDPEPMALFWYARGATGMPLLQFLAYYQVLEFYFASYSEQEARRRIANIVKRPNFDPHGERDLTRIFNAAISGGRGRYGDEKTQLRATIQGCADPSDLRSLLSGDAATQSFFRERIPGLTEVVLKADASDDQLLDAVAARVYDIRCRIVHQKEASGDEVGLLLPFSREAEQLTWDLELMEQLARSALVARSRRLSI